MIPRAVASVKIRFNMVILVLIMTLLVSFSENVYSFGRFQPVNSNYLKDLQKSMKDLFGFKNQPRAEFFSYKRNASSAKDYMMKLYKYTQGEIVENVNETLVSRVNEHRDDQETEVADTVVSFVNNVYSPRPNTSDESGAFFFDITSNFIIEKTLKSELRLYFDATKKKSLDNVFHVTIHQIIIPGRQYQLLSSKTISITDSSWYEFDILKATQSWKDDPATNNGILVKCETLYNQRKRFDDCGFIGIDGEEMFRPFLVSFYQSGDSDEFLAEEAPEGISFKYERFRRSLMDLISFSSKEILSNKNKCERHPLYIEFKDLKWSDWFLAPPGFKANYCGGECKFPLHPTMNASNHAIIQTLVHLLTPEEIPEPCCVPVNLEPLQVLFIDETNSIIMKNLSKMIVQDCGCR